jgi:uncharacterized membrane protein YgdD (TMEM256/DUF423 family)
MSRRPVSVDSPWRRGLAACGAVFCALALALSAYAAHGLEGDPQARLQGAVVWLFLHGLALALFAPSHQSWLERGVLFAWLLGSVLFCGSLILSVLAGAPTVLAPFGGSLLIGAWLVQAVAAWRRQ